MDKFEEVFEQIKVAGHDLADRIKELIHEGNVRRIIVKDEHGHTFMEIPVSVAAVGAILAPVLAAAGAIASMVAKFTIVVERTPGAAAGPGSGAAEGSVNTAGASPEHAGKSAVKPEDIAGTGGRDSQGG
jgi:hypothetical protein